MYAKKETEGTVSVALTASTFGEDTYVVRVNRDTVKVDNIITEIASNYTGVDPYTMEHALSLVKDQIIKYIKEGRTVDMLELGTLYPAAKGTVSQTNPQVADLPALELRFKPSKQAKEALGYVKPQSFMVRTPEPEIARVVSLKDGSEDGALHKGCLVRLTGAKLKVAGEAGGIFFVPADSEGLPSKDESEWIKAADSSFIPLNYPKTLEFNVPDDVEEGKSYFIAVRTAYSPSGRLRSEAVTGFSGQSVVISS